jgi:hypothetical protein
MLCIWIKPKGQRSSYKPLLFFPKPSLKNKTALLLSFLFVPSKSNNHAFSLTGYLLVEVYSPKTNIIGMVVSSHFMLLEWVIN